jgi:hypothetical protein
MAADDPAASPNSESAKFHRESLSLDDDAARRAAPV